MYSQKSIVLCTKLVDPVYWIDDLVQAEGCVDAETRRAMDEAMEKYTDDFMDVDHRAVVDAGERLPVQPPAASTAPITHAPYTITPNGNGRGDCFIVHYNAPIDMYDAAHTVFTNVTTCTFVASYKISFKLSLNI